MPGSAPGPLPCEYLRGMGGGCSCAAPRLETSVRAEGPAAGLGRFLIDGWKTPGMLPVRGRCPGLSRPLSRPAWGPEGPRCDPDRLRASKAPRHAPGPGLGGKKKRKNEKKKKKTGRELLFFSLMGGGRKRKKGRGEKKFLVFFGPSEVRRSGGKGPAGPLPGARTPFLAVVASSSAWRRGFPPRDELTGGKFKGKGKKKYKLQLLLRGGEEALSPRGTPAGARGPGPGSVCRGLSPRVSALPPPPGSSE